MLRISEVANILKISKSLMYRMVQQGKILSIHIGQFVRVRESDLVNFIVKQLE
ncbi:MAG: helix-turn-helix domain-containing protein [Anaerolineaceae bacterium]|nr:helix-turn-helix domain-containing protein [Anaerolineaceae bacterium]